MEIENLAPLLLLIGLWWLISKAAGATSRKAERRAGTTPRRQPQAAPGQPEPEKRETVSPAAAAQETREERMKPTVSVTPRDESPYQGSLAAETGEGLDPCHEEQMASLNEAENLAPPEEEMPGMPFGLTWSGDEIVRGLVVSEILKRKPAGR